MKFKFEVEVWSWSLKLKFKVEVWSWSLKLKFEVKVWGWSLKLKLEVWSLKLRLEVKVWNWSLQISSVLPRTHRRANVLTKQWELLSIYWSRHCCCMLAVTKQNDLSEHGSLRLLIWFGLHSSYLTANSIYCSINFSEIFQWREVQQLQF